METFKVTSPFDKADFIRVNKIKWKILSVKARKQLIGIIITTIILLFLAIIEKNNGGSDDTFETFGFIFLLLTFWLFIFRHFQKLNYFRKIERTADIYEKNGMDCTYEFSEESVKYWDKEKTLEFKWNVFINYSIYKNFLILRINDSVIGAYIFERKENDFKDFDKVLELVKTKLEYKKM